METKNFEELNSSEHITKFCHFFDHGTVAEAAAMIANDS